jgi:uncharacterized protein
MGCRLDRKAFMTPYIHYDTNAKNKWLDDRSRLLLSRIKKAAHTFFSQAKESHDWGHTIRVHRLCLHIGIAEGADLLVTEAAVYLHDIGRLHQDRISGRLCHAQKGAAMASELLTDVPITCEQKENILRTAPVHDRIFQPFPGRIRRRKVIP